MGVGTKIIMISLLVYEYIISSMHTDFIILPILAKKGHFLGIRGVWPILEISKKFQCRSFLDRSKVYISNLEKQIC